MVEEERERKKERKGFNAEDTEGRRDHREEKKRKEKRREEKRRRDPTLKRREWGTLDGSGLHETEEGAE